MLYVHGILQKLFIDHVWLCMVTCILPVNAMINDSRLDTIIQNHLSKRTLQYMYLEFVLLEIQIVLRFPLNAVNLRGRLMG